MDLDDISPRVQDFFLHLMWLLQTRGSPSCLTFRERYWIHLQPQTSLHRMASCKDCGGHPKRWVAYDALLGLISGHENMLSCARRSRTTFFPFAIGVVSRPTCSSVICTGFVLPCIVKPTGTSLPMAVSVAEYHAPRQLTWSQFTRSLFWDAYPQVLR